MTNYASTLDPPSSPVAAAAKRRLTIPQTSKATQEDRPTPFFCRRKGESHQKIITRPGTISSLLTYEARRRSTHTRPQRPSHWQNQLPPSCLFKAADVGQPKIRSLQPTNGKSDLFWDLHLPSWQTVPPGSVLLLPSHASCAGDGGNNGDADPRPSKKRTLPAATNRQPAWPRSEKTRR